MVVLLWSCSPLLNWSLWSYVTSQLERSSKIFCRSFFPHLYKCTCQLHSLVHSSHDMPCIILSYWALLSTVVEKIRYRVSLWSRIIAVRTFVFARAILDKLLFKLYYRPTFLAKHQKSNTVQIIMILKLHTYRYILVLTGIEIVVCVRFNSNPTAFSLFLIIVRIFSLAFVTWTRQVTKTDSMLDGLKADADQRSSAVVNCLCIICY